MRGDTTVRPRENGLGWLTCWLSEIETVRLPCATATVATRTSRPMTMMPERSSMTILAARSGSTCNCSISVRKATTLPLNSAGIDSCTVEGSIGSAVLTPMKSLTAAAMRLAVVKSGLRSASRALGRRLSAKSISRSMMAPLAMRPTVGTPLVTLAACAFGREAADRDRALRHRIDVAVGAEQRGDEQGAALQVLGVAERGDGDVDARALGAEGRQVAGHHHGGDVAGADGGAADVDAHALQHRLQRLLGEGELLSVSPVPLRPTTRP